MEAYAKGFTKLLRRKESDLEVAGFGQEEDVSDIKNYSYF